uniref:Secreted protein n=1 Tax=Glossina morsitans morsitans TaxID=37546 RepID=A0A1B0ETN0_GLOMM
MKFQAIFFFLFAILVISQARPHQSGLEHDEQKSVDSPSSDPQNPCATALMPPFEDNVANDEPSIDSMPSEGDDTSTGASMDDESYMTLDDDCCR